MKKILFYGDSITDFYRHYEATIDSDALGNGYVRFIAGELFYKYPKKYQIINRGISGNTVLDLLNRFDTDLLALKPDLVSILIGVNDVWHGIDDPSMFVETKDFEERFYTLINRIQKELPKTKIIIIEPSFLHGTATDEGDKYNKFKLVYKFAKIEERIANERNIPFLKMQSAFNRMSKIWTPDKILIDGVHPNLLGAEIIAKRWINLFYKKIKGF